LNGRERAYWYPLVAKKQSGEFCIGCGMTTFLRKNDFRGKYSQVKGKRNILKICPILYIDHIDNDPTNTVLENLQLLCPSCNRIKNPKRVEPIPERPFTPEMAKNTKYEGPYRRWINEEVLENGGIPFENALDGGAERFGLSPETTRKYIRKMISSEGNFGMFEDSVVFKKDIPLLEEEKAKKQELLDSRHEELNKFSKQSF